MQALAQPFPVSVSDSSEDMLIAYAKVIKDEQLEYGFAFDREGHLLRSMKGGRTKLRFGHRDLFTLSQSVFMHNRPNHSSFSLPDMHAACMLNMLAMIAVTSTMLFCMTPPDDAPYISPVHTTVISPGAIPSAPTCCPSQNGYSSGTHSGMRWHETSICATGGCRSTDIRETKDSG